MFHHIPASKLTKFTIVESGKSSINFQNKTMKKNEVFPKGERGFVPLGKILKIMKVLSFVMLVFVMHVSARSYSQNTKFSMSLQNVTIKKVLGRIEDQSEYRFLYSDSKIDVEKYVDVDFNNETVENILQKVFTGSNVQFKIVGRQIVLSNINESISEQQKKSISGKVTDSTGALLPGVSVVIKGTTNGTITDQNGKYQLANVADNAILSFSFVGMKTQDVAVSGLTTINITLIEESVGIEEVVAVGYGVQKKSDLTGSIASVKSDAIENLPVRSITEALQGRVAGVMVNKSSGKPGSSSEIIIRGVGSINGLNPIFIIDGVNRGNNVNYNPKDVESIEIIKDASAAAIYGAQAAGGVVLITTKKGVLNQKAVVDVSSNVGVRQITKSYDMLETVPYIKARQAVGDNYALWNDPSSLPNTNWFDEVFQTGVEQSHNISIKGGTEKISYYVSGGYENEEGIQKNNKWERYSIRANSDYKLNKKFTFGTRIYATKILERPYTVDIPWRTLPYMAVYNADGSFASVPKEVEFSGGNPVANIAYAHLKNGSGMLASDLYFDWEILNGLHFINTGSAGLSAGYNDSFTQADNLRRSATAESYTKSSSYSESYTLTSTLNYAKIFARKHDFKIMLGYEIKNSNSSSLSATANSFPVPVAESFALSTNTNKTASGSLGYGRFLSQFGRINYAYNNRYLLTANIRRDGSPKFGPKNRWGVFPSVSVGWKLNEEPFFKTLGAGWVTAVKPRLSWGILGNDAALSDFSYVNSYKTVTLHSFDEVNSVAGYNSIKVVNEDIKWEEIHTINGGIDLSLFNSKLSVSAEYYDRKTKDMIYNLPIPWSAGIGENNNTTSTMPVNIGSIDNKGWEFSATYRDKAGDFNYSISANISHNTNKVINLGLPTAYIYSGTGSYPFSGTSPFKTVNGQPVGKIYGFKTSGLIKDQAQIDALNQNAKAKYTASTGKDASSIYYFKKLTGPGDLLFTDIDGDGRITDSDRTFIGNPWPKLQYGANIYVDWKNIDLTIDLVGVYGLDVFNCVKSNEQSFAQDYQSTNKIFNSSFSFDNGLTDQPAIGRIDPSTNKFVKDPNLNYSSYSDYFVEDGSYLKVKNICIGYTLPKGLLSQFKIDKVRIYVSGQNLFTFTKFTGLDPEFSNDVKNHGLYTQSTYPQTKLYSIGFDLSF